MRGGNSLHGWSRSDADEREVAVDEIHRLLSNQCRRVVLADLAAHYHPVPLYDLTHRVVTVVSDEQPTDSVYRDVETVLRHEHLPQMETAGLIQSMPNRVELTSNGLHVERLRRAFAEALTGTRGDT